MKMMSVWEALEEESLSVYNRPFKCLNENIQEKMLEKVAR